MKRALVRRTRSPAGGPVGQARHAPKRSAGSAHRLDLHLRSHLPEAGKGRGSDPPGLQHRSDEPASGRNRQGSRTRGPRRPPRRSSRMASVSKIVHSRQHHHYATAAEVPSTQSGRKHLAIYARQLALEPRLQILRRYRRSLLLCLEYADRPPLENHVHRITPLGTWVLINEIWYYASEYLGDQARRARRGDRARNRA